MISAQFKLVLNMAIFENVSFKTVIAGRNELMALALILCDGITSMKLETA